jgi:pyruvate kinase
MPREYAEGVCHTDLAELEDLASDQRTDTPVNMEEAMRFPSHKTKIVCTIGPASCEPAVLESMVRAGMNVARLNFAHGDPESHGRTIQDIRDVAKIAQRRVSILADLPGPKIRVGELSTDPVSLTEGAKIVLTAEPIIGDASRVSINVEHLATAVEPGDAIFLNDGFIRLKVDSTDGKNVVCQVMVGGQLRSHKGVNVPGVDLGLDAVTEQDLSFLEFALDHGVDAVSVSFVQCAEDIKRVRLVMAARGRKPFVIAKIERARAIQDYPAILEAADAIMVARGDLGVETPIHEIALLQKNLIRGANQLAKPVITATQMLESMTHNSRPTRAEVTDVSNAVLDGADAVMLSEESAIGQYPVEAVEMLASICQATEAHRAELTTVAVAPNPSTGDPIGDAVAFDVVNAADRLRPRLIISHTRSGATARRICRFKPRPWVVAFSPEQTTCRQLAFSYGVYAVHLQDNDSQSWIEQALRWCRRQGFNKGIAILTAGTPRARLGDTNYLEIIPLEDL